MSLFETRFDFEAKLNSNHSQDKCFHQFFERQAVVQPDHIAIICNGKHLTYAELNARANQLAWHLRSRGAKPETLIPICVDRSEDMAVGILGILKSGAAYV
ncbi:MAG TPA: AMP-binding protein, partial [Pyrinomonadaceae bacterium]|nr:AMP-binding protein [Pyrinomonadaceae bacterium]